MTSYWLATDATPVVSRPLDGPAEVEIVGAGITGIACAHALATAGLRVRVFDAREVAGGASGRNGGFLLRGAAAPYDVVADSVGNDVAARIWRWTEDEIRALQPLAGDVFDQVGSLRVAVDAEEREELRAEYEAMCAAGIAAEWVDKPTGPPAGRFTAGLFHPPDGTLQPARWVRRLAGHAVAAGAEIVEHRRIESLDELEAPVVVIATDGYPSGLLGPLEGLIVPTRGQVLTTEPVPEDVFRVPHYGRHGFDYWHRDATGRIVLGGFRDVSMESEFTADEALTPVVQESLERFAAELLGRPTRDRASLGRDLRARA